MINLDHTLLAEMGLESLPPDLGNALLRKMHEALEMRVGMTLADEMSESQLHEFEQYFETQDDAGAFSFLEENFPHYRVIVQTQFDRLRSETSAAASALLASAQRRCPTASAS